MHHASFVYQDIACFRIELFLETLLEEITLLFSPRKEIKKPQEWKGDFSVAAACLRISKPDAKTNKYGENRHHLLHN